MTDHLDVGGLRIAYERAGSGPPVALLHGFVGDGRATWMGQIETLAEDFTVVAWDAPGAGASTTPPEWFRAADYADCLVALLEELGFRRAHLVGLSFGGIVALTVAERRPEVAASLTLVDSYAGWRGSLPDEEVDARLARCLELSELEPDAFAAAMVPSMFSPSASSRVVDEFAATVRSFDPAGFRVMSHASAEADLRQVLPRIAVPTLVLQGDADTRSPLRAAEAMTAAIPMARLVVLPGVGHVSSVEAPDAVARELGGFLRSTGVRD